MWARNWSSVLTCVLVALVSCTAWAEDEETRRKRLVKLATGDFSLPAPVGKVYSLEALIDRTLEQNPAMVARKHAELFAAHQRSEADWAYGPMVKVDSTFTVVPAETDINRVQGNLEKYFNLDIGPFSASTVRVIIPIYTFGKIEAARDLAQLGVERGALETRKQRLKLISQTRQAYLSLQLGKHIKAVTADGQAVIKQEIERQLEAREFGDEEIDIVQLRKL